MGEIHWNPDASLLLTGLLWSLTGFACYYFLSKNGQLSIRLSSIFPSVHPAVIRVMLQRAWGVLFLGIIPFIIVMLGFRSTPSDFGLHFTFLQPPPLWSYALIPMIPVMSYFTASMPSNLAFYPQIRSNSWTRGTLWINGVSWIVFLIAYEFLFRGFLLFSSLPLLDPFYAIILNVGLYASAHFYKGPSEVVGSIPIGFVFCYMTLMTGNIWSAVTIHSIMAISHEWFSLRAHPEMKLIKK